MKIIDLLVKISKGERMPKKIKYKGYVWEYDKVAKELITEMYWWRIYLFIQNLFEKETGFFINNEVEIIEENKKIEKIDTQYFDDERYTPEQRLNVCMNYIDDLIDEVNKLKGEK